MSRLPPAAARERFATARVARLATVSADGAPHLVVLCFALDGETLVSAVDAKPKATSALRRLANVRFEPRVSLLADHYEEDWSMLWWARADGRGRVLERSPHARELLEARYPQYRRQPPDGPFLHVEVERWSGWAAV